MLTKIWRHLLLLFNMYDSATIYQTKAIKCSHTQSANRIAVLNTSLAKYLLLGGNTEQALAHLRKAQPLKKIPMTEYFWNHTFGLYFMRVKAHSEARKVFIRCEVLYTRMLAQATDMVSRRTINECGKELYQDFRKLRGVKTMEYELYGAKLHAIKISLASDECKIKNRDKLAEKDRQLLELKKPDSLAKSAIKTNELRSKKTDGLQSKRKEAQHYPPDYWLWYLGITAIASFAGLYGFKLWHAPRVIEKEVPQIIEKEIVKIVEKELPLSQQRSVTETILLESLGFDLNKRPEEVDYFPGTLVDKKYIILKYYRGMSYRWLGYHIGRSASFVKNIVTN